MSRASREFRRMLPEFARFAVVGAIGLLVTGGVFSLMISGHQAAFPANAVATVAAAVVTFAGNRYWTFRHRERTGLGRETTVFIVLNLIGILIQQACLELASRELGAGDKLALNAVFLVGVGLATAFRFWSYRRFVWLAQRPRRLVPGTGASQSAIGFSQVLRSGGVGDGNGRPGASRVEALGDDGSARALEYADPAGHQAF